MASNPSSSEIVLTPRSVTKWLGAFTALLLVAHLGGLFSTFFLDHDRVFGLIPLFDLAEETNVPTLFSVTLFLINAGLAFLIWRSAGAGGRAALGWLLLASVMAFLALDEFASIHERLEVPTRDRLGLTGILYFAWYVPYAVLVVGFAGMFLPTLLRLEKGIRNLMVLSGVVFLAGAVGFEALAGWRWEYLIDTGWRPDLLYGLITGVEETLEMAGLIILVGALMMLLGDRGLLLRFRR